MLVLTRRKGEKIIIDHNIVVTILSIDGNQIRIGVEAPKEINVVRKELLHGKNTSKRSA